MFPTRTAQRGFSLPELLLAMGIVAVLVLLGVGSAGTFRERSLMLGCLSNLRQLGVSIHAYAAEHQGELPNNWPDSAGKEIRWQVRLNPYVPPVLDDDRWDRKPVFTCPAAPRPLKTAVFYALNQEMRFFANRKPLRMSEIIAPQFYVLLADAYGQSWITSGRAHKMIDDNGLTQRHHGKPNFLYADGHVAPFTVPLLGYSDTTDPFYLNLWWARGKP